MASLIERTFFSQIQELGTFADDIGGDQIKNEPMFFNCNLDFARQNAGPITKSFIESLPYDWRMENLVFDSRVHMLMPGWYPAIPGWHHDDVPRGADGQPDYDNPSYQAEHIMGLVNAHVSRTHFAIGMCKVPPVLPGYTIYKAWHDTIENEVANLRVENIYAEDRRLYYFDCDTFHTASKATTGGWRWFGRVSRGTDRINHVTNEIRRQVQVYLEFPTEGW